MRFTIHRGSHEIGGSCVEFESNDSRIVIDIGMPLVRRDGSRFNINDYDDVPKQELTSKGILPNIKGIYAWDIGSKPIDGLLISHPHADHYGLYRYLSADITVYLGEATHELIRISSLFGRQYHDQRREIGNARYFSKNKSFACGNFTITPYIMDHSGFDSYAFLIEADGKKVIYSGDFRHHGRKKYALPRFIKSVSKLPDAMLLEGTMLGRESGQVLTEDDITDKTIEISKDAPGMILLYLSAQNIDRLVSFYKAALSTNKLFVIDVYTAYILLSLKRFGKLPYPSTIYRNVRIFFGGNYLDKLPNEEKEQFIKDMKSYKITSEEIMAKPEKVMMIIRGSMINSLRKLRCLEKALLIYSMWEGYLKEKSMEKILEFIDTYKIQRHNIHTSGHASVDTLKYVVESIKPETLVPIHTFHPEQYKILAHNNIVQLSDGEPYSL